MSDCVVFSPKQTGWTTIAAQLIPVAQTFTVDTSGELKRIQVALGCTQPGNGGVFEIQTTTATGEPSNVSMLTVSANSGVTFDNQVWYTLTFPSSVDLTVGTKLAIVFKPGPSGSTYCWLNGPAGNPYPGGGFYHLSSGAWVKAKSNNESDDMSFKIVVRPR
jgi:hypothetical protein